MKKLFSIAAMALLVGFVGCTKTDDGSDNGDSGKNIRMKIEQLETKGEFASMGVQAYAFTSGEIYFVANATNMIVDHYSIGSFATDLPGKKINLTALTSGSGVNITGIPANADKVYVVGNVPTGVTLNSSGSFVQVKDKALGVATQSNAAGNLDAVVLYGTNAAAFALISGNDYQTVVAPTPLAARVELTDMKLKANSHIVSYKVQGIYMNNIYLQKQLDGDVVAGDLHFGGSVHANYVSTIAPYTTMIPSTSVPALCNSYSPTGRADVSGTVAAGSGKVWGYNLFGHATLIPHIVIHLTDIVCESGYSYTETDGYLTIKGFKDATTLVPITSFDAGKIYKVAAGAFEFGLDDITTDPELGEINLLVKVTLGNWEVQGVKPTL